MARSNEPFWWALFSAGGVVIAFFMPVTIFITSIATFTGLISPDQLWHFMHTPGFRVYLFVLISLSLFHWAHRFRFTLVDLGLKAVHQLVAVLCYGTAITGTVAALVLLLRM
jgi:fumarate reductase subunit D